MRADADVSGEYRTGGDVGVGADHAFVFDDRARVDDGVVADSGEGVDDRTGADEDARADRGRGINACGWVNDGHGASEGARGGKHALARGQATDAEDGAQGRGRVIGEWAKPREVQVAGQQCLRCIIEEAIDDKPGRRGGTGDNERVTAATDKCDVGACGGRER